MNMSASVPFEELKQLGGEHRRGHFLIALPNAAIRPAAEGLAFALPFGLALPGFIGAGLTGAPDSASLNIRFSLGFFWRVCGVRIKERVQERSQCVRRVHWSRLLLFLVPD